MKLHILIVDDEILSGDLRLDEYNAVQVALDETNAGFSFEFHFAESGLDAIAKLNSIRFDFVVLDAVLEEGWLGGVSHRELLDGIASAAPFALVTSRFDDSSMDLTSSVMRNGRCQCFISWLEFAAFANHPAPLFSLVASCAKDLVALDSTVKLLPDETVHLLHLSDIQSGGYPSEEDKVEIQIITSLVLDACGGTPPTFIVISGDLAEKGLPSEFDGAVSWISELCSSLGMPELPNPRVFSVPGNHDFCIPLAASANVSFKAQKAGSDRKPMVETSQVNSELTQFGFAPYNEIQEHVSQGRKYIPHNGHRGSELNWIDGSFAHLGIVFYGLNSVWPISSTKLPERSVDEMVAGKVGAELEILKKNVVARLAVEPFVVGVMHHSPFGDVGDRSITNTDFMAKFLIGAGSADMLLFGHVHKSDIVSRELRNKKRVVTSRASTVTKRGAARLEDSNRGLNLISLKRSNGSVSACEIDVFEWRGEMLAHSDSSTYKRF